MANSKILTSEDKMKLRQPIDEYVGKIQKQIDVLRKDGTAKVLEYQNVLMESKGIVLLQKENVKTEFHSIRLNLKKQKQLKIKIKMKFQN